MSQIQKQAAILSEILQTHMDPTQWEWAQTQQDNVDTRFPIAFASAAIKAGKKLVMLNHQEQQDMAAMMNGVNINGWSLARICRVWLLLQLDISDKPGYLQRIERLFRAAEMNELVALYSALPLLAYPESWVLRCAEGIRSNIGDVLRAIICDNPYPAAHLAEPQWNQLVLKAFFVALPVEQIIGLQQRMNPALAATLQDYRDERRSAGRDVHPMIDQLLMPYHTKTDKN